MWFKDIFLNDLIPAMLNIIPTIFGGLYESISVYDIISVPLVICFLCGVIVIFARAIEYIQEILKSQNTSYLAFIERLIRLCNKISRCRC